MDDKDKNQDNVNVSLDPNRTPVLYTDAVYIKANKNGVVLDFAQQVGPSNQYNVVTRIGMSREHAQEMIENLEALLRNDPAKTTHKKN